MKNRFFLHWILPLLIAAIAIGLAVWFVTKAPKARPKPSSMSKSTFVEVIKPDFGNFNVEIDSVGEVIPLNSLSITAKISGEVIQLSPNLEPGRVVAKGELLAKLDDSDYQLVKKQREAAIQKAQSDLQLEHGRQVVAKNDLKLLKRSKKMTQEQLNLALRKPQLLQYQASLTQAQAALDETKLAIKRTKIYAPWDAIVLERNISLGSNLTAQQPIATLIDSNRLRIKVSISANKLPLINADKEASTAQIRSSASDTIITGKIFSVLPSLSSNSRMAQLLIDVETGDSSLPLLKINDYVQVKIIGKQLTKVNRVSRTFIRDGNSLWLMRNNALAIISPEFIHEDKDSVYFSSDITEGLQDGDMIITSSISAPVQGMRIINKNDAVHTKPKPKPKPNQGKEHLQPEDNKSKPKQKPENN